MSPERWLLSNRVSVDRPSVQPPRLNPKRDVVVEAGTNPCLRSEGRSSLFHFDCHADGTATYLQWSVVFVEANLRSDQEGLDGRVIAP
jgi:hypothetical protein